MYKIKAMNHIVHLSVEIGVGSKNSPLIPFNMIETEKNTIIKSIVFIFMANGILRLF